MILKFCAIASIPSFELWLLLHYADIQAPLHRDEALKRLKQHIPGYEKGTDGAFVTTRQRLEVATQRARTLTERHSAYSDPEPYTGVVELVYLLINLRR